MECYMLDKWQTATKCEKTPPYMAGCYEYGVCRYCDRSTHTRGAPQGYCQHWNTRIDWVDHMYCNDSTPKETGQGRYQHSFTCHFCNAVNNPPWDCGDG